MPMYTHYRILTMHMTIGHEGSHLTQGQEYQNLNISLS